MTRRGSSGEGCNGSGALSVEEVGTGSVESRCGGTSGCVGIGNGARREGGGRNASSGGKVWFSLKLRDESKIISLLLLIFPYCPLGKTSITR